MPTVFIPASLRKHTGDVRSVVVSAGNVREVIEELEKKFPGIREKICEDGQLRKGVSVAVDSRVLSHGMLEKVSSDSEVHFVPSVSGG